MKPIQNLSIGGYAFKLENDAAERLKGYIGTLESHYMPMEGGKEIMEGIEERIAELLLDKKADVVTLANVLRVIDIIGSPENIEADDPAPGADTSRKKKLYRDMENKRLGGVCSGLAAYLNFDVTAMRIIWTVTAVAIFFGGSGHGVYSLLVPVLYCVFWIAMPAARTASERWEMRGEDATLEGIRKNVENGFREMGQAAREAGSSDAARGIGRFLVVLVGLILLIVGVSGLATCGVLAFKGKELFGLQLLDWWNGLRTEYPNISTMVRMPWVGMLVSAAAILPFVGMLYGACQLIFGFKEPSWKPGLWIFVIWLIVLVVLGVVGFAGVFDPTRAVPGFLLR